MTEPVVAVIPARLGSSRFPGKVLARVTGKPLIQHVHEAASRCRALSRIVVATDAEEVASTVRAFGGEAVITDASHPNGTSRIHEAATALRLAERQLIVNVQGDEPELEPAVIVAALDAFAGASPEPDIATVATPFRRGDDPADPNIVKVVRRLDGTALYFSRAPVPHRRDLAETDHAEPLRHVGIYVYRRDFLRRYAAMPATPLEHCEKLEQLRALEHGLRIAVGLTDSHHAGIDTPEQYDAFVRRHRARLSD